MIFMAYYRQCRITKRIFRRCGSAPEEYVAKNKEWVVTGDAIEAFHDSSYYSSITGEEAKEAIEKQNKAFKKESLGK